jgi:hypothetical protein
MSKIWSVILHMVHPDDSAMEHSLVAASNAVKETGAQLVGSAVVDGQHVTVSEPADAEPVNPTPAPEPPEVTEAAEAAEAQS